MKEYIKRIINEEYKKLLVELTNKYDIASASMGNGTTYFNRAEEKNGDYVNVAHVSDSGEITWYDEKLPPKEKKSIEAYASKKKSKSESIVNEMAKGGDTLHHSADWGDIDIRIESDPAGGFIDINVNGQAIAVIDVENPTGNIKIKQVTRRIKIV